MLAAESRDRAEDSISEKQSTRFMSSRRSFRSSPGIWVSNSLSFSISCFVENCDFLEVGVELAPGMLENIQSKSSIADGCALLASYGFFERSESS